jgi:putative ABC transport system permease protein
MEHKPLTTYYIALSNLKRKLFRSVALSILVALFACTLFGGTILTGSLRNGMNQLSNRLGADILAVPYGYEADLQSALLRGEPSTFYFDASFTEKLAAVEGVASVSPQLYVSTINADCCAYPIQLIGFEESTDFVIQPWMSDVLERSLEYGEIVVGNSINANPGTKLKFFGNIYIVAARLDKTGMGFDTSIFVNLETAKDIAAASERIQAHPAVGDEELISSVTIKIKDGYDGKTVANNILQAYAIEGVHVVVAKNLISGISGNLRGLSVYIYVLAGILWVVAIGVLILVFSVTLNARRREFSIYRVLGAPKTKLTSLVFFEAAIIGLWGTIAGMGVAALVYFPFNFYIRSMLELPFLRPPLGQLLATAAISFIISFSIGPLASVYAAIRLGKSEIYRTIREGE